MNRSQLRYCKKEELKEFLQKNNVPFDENADREALYILAVNHIKALEDQGLQALEGSQTAEPTDATQGEQGAPNPEVSPEGSQNDTLPPQGAQKLSVPQGEATAGSKREPSTFTEEASGQPADSPYAGMGTEELMIELRVMGFSDKKEILSHIEAYQRERTTLAYEKGKLDEYSQQIERRKIALDKKEKEMEAEELKLQVLAREQRYYLEEIVKHKNDPTYMPPDPSAIRGKAEIDAQKSMEARVENRKKNEEEEKKKKLDVDLGRKREVALRAAQELRAAESAAKEAGVDIERKQRPPERPMRYVGKPKQ